MRDSVVGLKGPHRDECSDHDRRVPVLSQRGSDAIMPSPLQQGESGHGQEPASRPRRRRADHLVDRLFLFFLAIASRSNNPSELIRVVGTVSGVVGGVGVAMMVFGKVGKKT
jgi:hypothetical protein